MKHSLRFAFVFAALGGLVSCGGSSHPAPTQPAMNATPTPVAMNPTPMPGAAAHVVNVGQGGNNFVDSQAAGNVTTVRAGTTVTWVWMSGPHSTTSGVCCSSDGKWDSGVKSSGSFSHVFSSAGNFPYFCTVHGSMMTGVVMVTP